jgi:signal transduction histidine kinase
LLTLIVLFSSLVWRVARRLSAVAAERAAAERATSRARAEADRLALENFEALAQRASLMESERAARLEAERAARLKDEFLATLSHELRTPLNAILGWTAIARQTHGHVPELARPLETIERNARVQAQLIEDLLDISRIVSGQMRLAVEAVELPLVVQAAVTAVTPAASGKQIRLEIDLEPDLVSVTGDAARLQQVLWNLLSNAVKFTPNGGRVQLGVRRRGALVELTVSDDGIGIAPEFLPHVFDRFRQADSSITRRHGGLGLGLSIVKQLVELHGGTVTVASAGENRGASFVVLLPLHAESDEDAELRAARTPLRAAEPSTRAR